MPTGLPKGWIVHLEPDSEGLGYTNGYKRAIDAVKSGRAKPPTSTFASGDDGTRTHDFLLAKQVL